MAKSNYRGSLVSHHFSKAGSEAQGNCIILSKLWRMIVNASAWATVYVGCLCSFLEIIQQRIKVETQRHKEKVTKGKHKEQKHRNLPDLVDPQSLQLQIVLAGRTDSKAPLTVLLVCALCRWRSLFPRTPKQSQSPTRKRENLKSKIQNPRTQDRPFRTPFSAHCVPSHHGFFWYVETKLAPPETIEHLQGRCAMCSVAGATVCSLTRKRQRGGSTAVTPLVWTARRRGQRNHWQALLPEGARHMRAHLGGRGYSHTPWFWSHWIARQCDWGQGPWEKAHSVSRLVKEKWRWDGCHGTEL